MKTILNKMLFDTLKQPMFLGESLSLQRYDSYKYSFSKDLYDSMLQYFWLPNEISLINDRSDYEKLSPVEQNIFTTNLSWQILGDSAIGRNINTLLEYVSLPEIESLFQVWTFFENIHSNAYTYIVKNVYVNPGDIFDNILNNKNIMLRAQNMVDNYDALISAGKNDIRDHIYLSLVGLNILEGIQFYTSFAVSYVFAENKKLIGSAEIVRLVNRDENKHVSTVQRILKTLATVQEEGFMEVVDRNQDIVVDMFRKTVAEDKEWIKYLFRNGSVMGLNDKILETYLNWLAMIRMKALNLPQIFDSPKSNILGWLKAWNDSSMIQTAPQETEITNYKISATKNDLDALDISEFKL